MGNAGGRGASAQSRTRPHTRNPQTLARRPHDGQRSRSQPRWWRPPGPTLQPAQRSSGLAPSRGTNGTLGSTLALSELERVGRGAWRGVCCLHSVEVHAMSIPPLASVPPLSLLTPFAVAFSAPTFRH